MILDELRELFLKNNVSVSKIELTSGNFDNQLNLIHKPIPTITTDLCEVGLHDNQVYFVFVIRSQTFEKKLFSKLKKYSLTIYPFRDFKKTLYPSDKFDYPVFQNDLKKDELVQIQVNLLTLSSSKIYEQYKNLAEIFAKSSVSIINQLNVDLKLKNR
jgi:hypothetical protein